MSKIAINGQDKFDIATLVTTRLLVQASSGGGKSFAIRRLVEQAFGKIQIIIIDSEGEFSTLREKYDFVLAAKGGDTPADLRSAALLAIKLLELNASAVCDLYEMKPQDRHQWVKLFLDSLMNAPKELWRPLLVVIDEAHKVCPERGKGESVAKDAVLSLVTAGRKRGFCAVLATQRLSKLDKDSAAELLNVMVGRTMLDVDRDRAEEILGIRKADKVEFHETIRTMQPGWFYVIGPAISPEVKRLRVGEVETTHPESGSAQAAIQPPVPAKIRALLPKLEDLPKEAEAKARTEADLRREIAELKKSMSGTRVEVVSDPKAIDAAVKGEREAILSSVAAYTAAINGHLSQVDAALRAAGAVKFSPPTAKFVLPANFGKVVIPPAVAEFGRKFEAIAHQPANGDLSGPEQRILNAIAWMESIGIAEPEQVAVAFLAGYTTGGGAYNNPRGRLNQRGFIRYLSGDRLALTDEGRRSAQAPQSPLDKDELQRMVMERLPGPEQKILKVLLDYYPQQLSNEDVAQASGYTLGGGAFNNPRGRLRTLGLIHYPTPGFIAAKPLLFLEQ